MRAAGIRRRVVPQRVRADAGAVADGDRGGVAAPTSVVIHAAENGGTQALRQRVGGECPRRLMSMLSYALDSSTAPSAALAAATERPSAVSATIVEWGAVPQTPTATTTSGSKVHVCGTCAPGTMRATEAHRLCMSHGSYLACLRPTAVPRLASSALVTSAPRCHSVAPLRNYSNPTPSAFQRFTLRNRPVEGFLDVLRRQICLPRCATSPLEGGGTAQQHASP